MGERFVDTPIVLLDAGNFSDNPTPAGDIKTKTLLRAMERLNYRVINVGERDIRMGYDALLERMDGIDLQFISSNIIRRDTEEAIFPTYAVVEVGEGKERIRIGVIGAVRYNPIFLKPGPDKSDIVITHPVERVKLAMEEMRSEKVDLVVLLAALPKHDATRLAQEVPGIDFIFGAYGGMFAEERVGDTSVVYCGNRGQRLAEARVFAEDRSKKKGLEYREVTRMHFLTAAYPDSAEMKSFVEEARAAAAAQAVAASANGQPGAAAGSPR